LNVAQGDSSMLAELTIRNLAIVEEVHLTLGPGLTVFTGETGAGKSILVDAVELLLGARADTTLIRQGAAQAYVEGIFQLQGPTARTVRELLGKRTCWTRTRRTPWSWPVRSGARGVTSLGSTDAR